MMSARNLRLALTITTCLSSAFLAVAPASAQSTVAGNISSVTGNNGNSTSVVTSGSTSTITAGNSRTILNWDSLNLAPGQTLNFVVGGADHVVLNRVIGPNFSEINGNLNSTISTVAGATGGHIFVINTNGIVFGINARVNVGGLVASTLDLTDADFFDGGSYHFTGAGWAGVNTASTSQLRTSNGPLVLLGGYVANAGMLTSGGDVVLAAASDVTLSTGAGSPLSMTINQGTPVEGTLVNLGGVVTGVNVYAALASRAGVTNSLLNVGVSVTATTATATDRGIVLAAGTSASGITVASGGSNDTTGAGRIAINGSLTANALSGVPAGVANIEARSKGNINIAGITLQATLGDIRLEAGDLLIGSGGTRLRARDIHMTADDWSSILGPAVLQESRDLYITDTAYGLYVTAATEISAQRNLSITTQGGNLRVGGVAAGTQASGVGNMFLSSDGTLELDGAINVAGDTLQLTGADVVQNLGTIAANIVTGSAVGEFHLDSLTNTIASLGTIDANSIHVRNTTSLNVAGAINATSDVNISTQGDLTVNAPVTAQQSSVSLAATNNGSDIVLNAPVSAATILELFAMGTGGTVSQTAAGVATGGTLYGMTAANFTLDNAANRFDALGLIEAANISVRDSSGGLTIGGQLKAGAGTGTVDVRTLGGRLYITPSGEVRGGLVTLSTDGLFDNASGFDAVIVPQGGRWAIYAAAPTGSSFGNLNSNNQAIWAGNVTSAPISGLTGNRYVFAFQPTLTVSSTDLSKVYGTDLTGALNGNYSVSGLQSGVAGAYLGDSLATVLSGAPTITSAGAAANADVAGGPYILNVAQGSLAANNGYALLLNSAGRLTVTPKAINATVTANDKTYDGTTAATGTVTLNGVIAGDSVGTSGTTFTFTDKNAGVDKTVTVAGVTLTGDDAGNYTLTVPASALADIFAKAIDASVSANSKTYDGTLAATGTVTLNGVVAGDSVGTSGTTFAFSNKNAGTGKTVTISGTTLTGADAGNYTLTVPASALADIFAKAIDASVSANSKTYDGTSNGTGTVTLNGVIAGDSVGTTGTTFTFSDKNAGTGKTVTIAGTTLTGADAGNYTLTVPASALADIFAKAIDASVSANSKTYDGTTAGTGTVTLNGVVAGDSVGTSGTTFAFTEKNAGTGKTVTISGTTLTGTDAGNYSLTVPATALADIFAKAISATVAANSKTYDGTTATTGTVTLDGVIAGDSVGTSGTTFSFSDKNTGTGKTVTIAGTTLTGADAGNYTLTVPASALADIFAKAIDASVSAHNKTYDGTTAATGTVTLNGVVAGDSVGTSGTAFTFSDKNAGTGKTVTISGTTLTGADAGNYTLTVPASALADIFAKAIDASVAANSKTYDGTTAGTGTVTLNGVIAGDSVGTSGTTFTFSDKNAGTGKTVTIAGTTLTGADAGNYTLTVPASALADIFAKAIDASVSANNKTYDGTTAATGTVTLNGVVAGDSVGTSGTTFAFTDKNAGTGKTVTISGTSLTGTDAGNYSLTVPATALADIFAKAISATVAANSKTYDGTTATTGTVTLDGVVAGDSVGSSGTTFTFSDKNAGAGKTVTVTGTTLTGADAGNYTLTVPASALADIFAKAIDASVSANSKTYDGTTSGTGTVTLNGVVAGDSVGTSGTTFTFGDKNAGTGKTVTIAGTTLTGADAGNYTLTVPATTLADILQRALQIVADDATKIVGTADPAFTYAIVGNGLVAGDSLSGALARDPGENLGSYAINQGSLSAGSNYSIAFTPGTLTIERDVVADTAKAQSNPLRALPLPGDIAKSKGQVLTVDIASLCPETDQACMVQ